MSVATPVFWSVGTLLGVHFRSTGS